MFKKSAKNQHLIEAADAGDAASQCDLGVMYELGLGFEKNLDQAFVYFEKSAEQGYAKAQYNLGVFYAMGKSVNKDLVKAKYWIKKAHDNGYTGTGFL